MLYLIVVNAHTQCHGTTKQTLRQTATSHQTLHRNKTTTHCTASVAAEARKNISPPSCVSLYKMASGSSPIALSWEQLQPKIQQADPHSGTEGLSVAVPFAHVGSNRLQDTMQAEILPLLKERGSGEVCAFPRKCRGLLSASILNALTPNVSSSPAQV